jgi:hypothetical protein
MKEEEEEEEKKRNKKFYYMDKVFLYNISDLLGFFFIAIL